MDVGKDLSPFPHRCDDCRKVVIGQHHVSGVLGNFRPGDPHPHADVGRLEGWRIIDPVPSHCHHLVVGLPSFDDPDLVFWRHPGIDVIFSDGGPQFLIAELV